MRALLTVLLIIFILPTMAMKTYGPVKRGDSLWRIAQKNRPSRAVGIQQMVLAIKKLNPSVFKGHGASHLKLNTTLLLPTTVAEVNKALHPEEATPTIPAPATVQPRIAAPTPSQSAAATAASKQIPLTINTGSATLSANITKTPLITSPTTSIAQSKHEQSIPWSWLWFILLVVGAAYFFWYRKYHETVHASINKGLAAARLGVTKNRRERVVNRYKTRRFKDRDAAANHFQTVNKTPFMHSSGEALASAAIDMAENNCTSAEQSLRMAILRDKKNVELRIKLLELYVKTNNRVAFKRESDALEHFVSSDSSAWSKVKAMYLNQWAYD